MTPDSDIKMTVLMAVLFLFIVFIAVLIILRTLGNIHHSLNRLEDIINREVILSHNREVGRLRSSLKRKDMEVQRQARRRAMLNIPLADPPTAPPPTTEEGKK